MKKSNWQGQNAVVISDTSNLQLMIKQLLKSSGWNISHTVSTIKEALFYVYNGHCQVIIIDDTSLTPSSILLRELITDPLGCCIPTVILLQEHNRLEIPAIEKMGNPAIVNKPLTPGKFIPAFDQMIHAWEKQSHFALRMGIIEIQKNYNPELGIHIFQRLKAVEAIKHLVNPALAIFQTECGKLKEAETTLLNALRDSPGYLNAILTLSDLYLKSAMPETALRLLLGARRIYEDSLIILPDLIQIYIILDNFEKAQNLLYYLRAHSFMPELIDQITLKTFYAQGRFSEGEQLISQNKALNRVKEAWQRLDREARGR